MYGLGLQSMRTQSLCRTGALVTGASNQHPFSSQLQRDEIWCFVYAKYMARLSAAEREQLDAPMRKGKNAAGRLMKARILLKADVSDAERRRGGFAFPR